jgi:Holliday junction resolvase RusA-like endonuclease
MVMVNGEWEVRLWIPGKPKSFQSGGSHSRYKETIRDIARQKFPRPLNCPVEVQIIFADKYDQRPDADNVLKTAIDALKTVAYFDDCQVVKPSALVVPMEASVRTSGGQPHWTYMRLQDHDEFLIRIKEVKLPVYTELATSS